MNRTFHRIQRQRWLVKAPSQEAAFAIRQQLRSQLDTALLPVFEHAFDALAVGDEVVHIPRLALDLKLSPGEDFITALTDVLRDSLAEALQEAVITHPEQAAVRRIAVHASQRRTLLNYLTTGHLEWHANAEIAGNLLRSLHTEACALADEGHALFEALSGSLAQRTAASFRLLQLLPDEARPALLALAPLYTLASLPDRMPATVDAAIALLPIVLRQLATSGTLGSYLLLRVQAILLAIRKEDLRVPLETHILALLQKCKGQAALHASTAAPGAVLCILTGSPSEAESPTTARKQSAPPSGVTPDTIAPNLARPVARPSDDASSESYPASDAGLVLLHPFLPRLFDAVGIAPAGTHELPEAVLPRAAAMLHWLASGREEIYEFELTVIKVLLGLTPDHILLAGAGLLSEADRIEADALLAAAISHWDALGKTGVAALRMSFLQRRGLLRDIDSGWQLQVEPESFDLLLGKLPWGISIVRLPWMTRPIFTEWPTP